MRFRTSYLDSLRLLAVCLAGALLQACGQAETDTPVTDTTESEVSGTSVATVSPDNSDTEINYRSPQDIWQAPPEQVPVTEGYLDVGGAMLWYWDTGGDGEAVVFSHPGSGSGLSWEYQQPVLAEAGYRVIGYSRRGHYQSEVTDPETPGTVSDDLRQLLDHLAIDQVHIVALAAGANLAPDFATSYPERVLSLMLGCTVGDTGDPAYRVNNDMLIPDAFFDLPVWFRELSAFYRSANPEGARVWQEISQRGRGEERFPADLNNEFTPELLNAIAHPVLLFTGEGDLYMPPPRLVSYASYWRGPELVVFRGAGHAPYWEQPLAFNQTLLNFLQENPRRTVRD